MQKNLLFDRDEFIDRCRQFQNMMTAENIDLLIIDQPETMFHLIGYAMSEGFYQCCLLPVEGEPVMILRVLDSGTCKEFCWISDVVGYQDWDDPIETALAQIKFRKLKHQRVGIDTNSYSLTVQRFTQWQSVLADTEFKDISGFIAGQLSIKSAKEIDYLRTASVIADKTMQVITHRLKPGHSARDCLAMSAESIILLGGDAGVMGPVTRAIDDTKMHALVDDTPLILGDMLHVELIPQFFGYSARLMRPVCMGRPSAEIIDVAEQMLAIQDIQLNTIKPGVPAGEVDALIRDAMLTNGLKSSFPHISGYSLGYYQLFTGRSSDFSYVFRPNDTWLVKAGMVFHMYTVARGMAFSETFLVTESGGERLTCSDRSIMVIEDTRAAA